MAAQLNRLKADLSREVAKMLDAIQQTFPSAFSSPDFIFVETPMGGAQFLRPIIQRLQQNGFSDDNIRTRVLGLAEDSWVMNFVKNRYSLPVTLAVIDSIEANKINNDLEEMKKNNHQKRFIKIGNPPYSIDNTGKGGKAVYHTHALHKSELFDMIVQITPGTFIDQEKFADFREKLNEFGMVSITPVDPKVFTASVERPVWWIAARGATNTVESLTYTPASALLNRFKLFAADKHYNTLSGQADVDSSENVSDIQSDVFSHQYITRVKKTEPIILYCNDQLYKPIEGSIALAVFPQRCGMEPTLVFVPDASTMSYSQNVCVIGVDSKLEFDNLVTYMNSDIVKFILFFATAGKNTRKAMPRALTAGKIRWIPKMDLSRSWTNEETYSFFEKEMDLSKEDIKVIQDTIR